YMGASRQPDCRRYLFTKVGRERVHEPQGWSTSAKKVAAVDFLYSCLLGKKISPAALTGWIIRKKKDASGSPDRKDYCEEKGRLRQYLRNSDSNVYLYHIIMRKR
ncbi:hypothetical protein JW933_00910, partial [candidate division FCPU426 bacterium]|nr:hypothetical protein [candidate division FCPU426 bacterium]